MQQECDAQRFQNIDPVLAGDLIDVGVVGDGFVIDKLRRSGGSRRYETQKLQRVDRTGNIVYVAFHIG